MPTNQGPSDNSSDPPAEPTASSAYAVTLHHAELLTRLTRDVNTWKATLPFKGIVGFDGEVDLFDYVGTDLFSRGQNKHEIKFDPKLHPATGEGVKNLTKELKTAANYYGTELVGNGVGLLMCQKANMRKKRRKLQKQSQAEFMLHLYTSAEDKNELMAQLVDSERRQYEKKARNLPAGRKRALLGNQDTAFVSYGLPIDTRKESRQKTYHKRG